MHSRTHPPFAVLIHRLPVFARAGPGGLAVVFVLLSSMSIVLVREIMRATGLSSERSAEFALLFAVIPAYNIYGAVCLDAVIAVPSTMFLLGMVRIGAHGPDWRGALLFISGILLANLLTFAGALLFGIASLIGGRDLIFRRRAGILVTLLVSVVLGIALWVAMSRHLSYDHAQAFLTAVRLENSEGLRAFANPLEYTMTRIEGVAEIALFLSIGALAVLFRRDYLNTSILGIRDVYTSIFLAGAGGLLLMFLAGAYRTGETARACLLIYPYFLLILRGLEANTLRSVIIAAGLQTIVMQVFGGYVW